MKKNNIFLSGLIGGSIISFIYFLIAYVWSTGTWLREPMLAAVAIAAFIGGFIVSMLVQLVANKFGSKSAYILAGGIFILNIGGLAVLY